MLRHGDIFRARLTDNLYMIDCLSSRDNSINYYNCIRIVDGKNVIEPESFFNEECVYGGNLVKAQRKEITK